MTGDRKIRISAVGDTAFVQRPATRPFARDWYECDLRIANCECVMLQKGRGLPANKRCRLRSPLESAAWFREMEVDALSLANNHTMDFDREGMENTMRLIAAQGIRHCGAGSNLGEAALPAVMEVRGKRIALLSWSSTLPFGFQAGRDRPGIAGVRILSSYALDPILAEEQPGTPPWVHTRARAEDLETFEASVRYARSIADFVIVSYHWGVPPQYGAHAQGPVMEYQHEIAKRAAQAGAGIILGCHAHAPLGMGVYDKMPALFSLGNYIFHFDYLPDSIEFTAVTDTEKIDELLPENNQSCIVTFDLAENAGGLSVDAIRFHPASINALGEAQAATEQDRADFAARLIHLSRRYGCELKALGDGTLLWRP